MKGIWITAVIVIVTVAVILLDPLVVFLLSGSIPSLNITLAPSTMLALMVAGALLPAVLRHRNTVYRHCLALYDTYVASQNTKTPQTTTTETRLPYRRYQEL